MKWKELFKPTILTVIVAIVILVLLLLLQIVPVKIKIFCGPFSEDQLCPPMNDFVPGITLFSNSDVIIPKTTTWIVLLIELISAYILSFLIIKWIKSR